MERNVEIVTNSEKKKIVRIHNIRFRGKRSIDWGQVREYLRNYVGATHEIVGTKDKIYIGSDLPDEYSGSRYTYKLMGTLAYFELPVYDEDGEIERYNRFRATMLIRHSADGKKYLYDMICWT